MGVLDELRFQKPTLPVGMHYSDGLGKVVTTDKIRKENPKIVPGTRVNEIGAKIRTPSTNIPTESNPGGGVRNPNDSKSYPSGAEIKPNKKPSPPVMANSYDPLSNKKILAISEKILKKNSNLGEEGYDHYKDRIAMDGGDPSSPKKKDATTLPQKKRKEVKGKTVYQKQAEKE